MPTDLILWLMLLLSAAMQDVKDTLELLEEM